VADRTVACRWGSGAARWSIATASPAGSSRTRRTCLRCPSTSRAPGDPLGVRADARALPDAFLDDFAAIGDVARVTDRLRAIAATGVDRIVMIGGSLGIEMERVQRSLLALSTEVLPKLR
jgi:alkanesulfonate monooxygenase SsuD/methylene tetrahydromethanopterin reductase-like flavin-dependent oxidoreductase (luciferase family)